MNLVTRASWNAESLHRLGPKGLGVAVAVIAAVSVAFDGQSIANAVPAMARPPRLPRFSYRGIHRYFLTFCTVGRARLFEQSECSERALEQIRRTATIEGFAILAYCFMPDHLHLLVEGLNDGANLKRFAKMAKQRSGAAHALSGAGRLWQEGYWDVVLRIDDDLTRVVRYIVENPVRAGLAKSPREYPYLGSDVWTIDEISRIGRIGRVEGRRAGP